MTPHDKLKERFIGVRVALDRVAGCLAEVLEMDDSLEVDLGDPLRVRARTAWLVAEAWGGAACRECGCTVTIGCPEGCAWAEEDLCTACDGHLGPEDHELVLVLEHLRGWLARYPVTVFPDSHLPARMARHVLSSVIADLEVGRHRE